MAGAGTVFLFLPLPFALALTPLAALPFAREAIVLVCRASAAASLRLAVPPIVSLVAPWTDFVVAVLLVVVSSFPLGFGIECCQILVLSGQRTAQKRSHDEPQCSTPCFGGAEQARQIVERLLVHAYRPRPASQRARGPMIPGRGELALATLAEMVLSG